MTKLTERDTAPLVVSTLDRTTLMRLAATEYDRCADVLSGLETAAGRVRLIAWIGTSARLWATWWGWGKWRHRSGGDFGSCRPRSAAVAYSSTH